MLGGLFLLSASIAVVAVIMWSIMSDHTPPTAPTKGLFAMRESHRGPNRSRKGPSPEASADPPPPTPRGRRPRRMPRSKQEGTIG